MYISLVGTPKLCKVTSVILTVYQLCVRATWSFSSMPFRLKYCIKFWRLSVNSIRMNFSWKMYGEISSCCAFWVLRTQGCSSRGAWRGYDLRGVLCYEIEGQNPIYFKDESCNFKSVWGWGVLSALPTSLLRPKVGRYGVKSKEEAEGCKQEASKAQPLRPSCFSVWVHSPFPEIRQQRKEDGAPRGWSPMSSNLSTTLTPRV